MGDRLATIYMRQKGGVGQRAPYHRELDPNVTHVASAKATRIKWYPDPSSRLATTEMAKNWGLCPFFGGDELGPHLTQCH